MEIRVQDRSHHIAVVDTVGRPWRNHRFETQQRFIHYADLEPFRFFSMRAATPGVFAGVIIGGLIASIGGFTAMVRIIHESAQETKKTPP